MNKKKILILVILSIFVVGMVMGAASASHTFKKGKYKVKVSDKTYKQIKNGKKIFVKKVGTKTKKSTYTKKIKTYDLKKNPKKIKNGKFIKSKTNKKYRIDYYKMTKTEKIPVFMHVCKDYKGKIVVWINNHAGRGI